MFVRSCPASKRQRSWCTVPGTGSTGRRWGGTWLITFPVLGTSSFRGLIGIRPPRTRDRSWEEIEEFLTGVRPSSQQNRILATVLFTDIVDSTERAASLGDQEWLDLREAHDSLVRKHLDRFRGREIQTTGDGFLAIFDGPARAVRCATELADAVRTLGIEIRAGLHTGEVEVLDGSVGGIAVHIAARVMAAASQGGVVVSQTVKDLVVGSGIEFADRGSRSLKGVPGDWRLYEVTALP
jgi:class 3 adenylate cyclase